VLRARTLEKAEAAIGLVRRSLDRAVSKGKLSEQDRDATLQRITPAVEFVELADCDLVVEAVAEEIGIKKEVFAALDEVCKPGAVLATTTSSLPVIEVAAATSRPADVVGLHFFNPAQVMKLVEVVETISTGADVVATARKICLDLGKHPVHCGDVAGFIDNAMKVGCGLPMGPFALLDVVGLDVSLAIQRTLFNEFREPGFAPATLLEHLVTAGRLGRKTGKGFRDYS
jgi:3-hydroxybutyryl-CoA dehydrogenase